MRLLKFHFGLIKYLKIELKKKRTPKELVYFLKELLKIYFKELLKMYKQLFDLDYQKQQKNYKKYQQYRKDISTAWKIIQYMIKTGQNRTDRKQIRRDFEKHGRISKELEKIILRDVYGVK